ncbi:MAG: hypothetical protein K0S76_243 [Herbinix sp.]|nr:hypothetical protein [Herbinix sp.]
MKYRETKANYDKYPRIAISGYEEHGWKGYTSIIDAFHHEINLEKDRFILVVDTYPGVNDEEIIPELMRLKPEFFINMMDCFQSEEIINERMKYYLTEDRVFGKMYFGSITDFMDPEICNQQKKKISETKGLTIIYGFGAAALTEYDCLVYCDMARWEIQMRFRKGMGNYKADNGDEDILKKYKRGFFVEWRIADKHKRNLFDRIDYYLDTNRPQEPKMISGEAFREGLLQTAHKPFRTVPYFDPGVWGGQWMKEVCNLEPTAKNFAWSFDGVPEENSLYLQTNLVTVEVPAMNLVLYQPKKLLGEKVYTRFGAEFPIRFDFLDTMGGQNLSLQVHPLTDYIHNEFGMQYTQDESYYILDAQPEANVYLGIKDEVKPEQMLKDLKAAQEEATEFRAEEYVNQIPAKKHDHFLIPAGTVHCSGSGCMVLEISATPYIFTFKLWDWGRLGLDGRPRPIHIEHGEKVIQWDRRTSWVKENLVNQIYTVEETKDYREEHTGLHELEFIETRRYWINGSCSMDTQNTVNMLNLIEGSEAVVESPVNAFEPFTVHYAETFIIPASVGSYIIRGTKPEETIGVIKAYVRG